MLKEVFIVKKRYFGVVTIVVVAVVAVVTVVVTLSTVHQSKTTACGVLQDSMESPTRSRV